MKNINATQQQQARWFYSRLKGSYISETLKDMSAESVADAFVQHYYQTRDNNVQSLGGLFVSQVRGGSGRPMLRPLNDSRHVMISDKSVSLFFHFLSSPGND